MVRSLGAEQVIDYASEDFTSRGETYDLILDIVAKSSLSEIKRALKPRGAYVAVAFNPKAMLPGADRSKQGGQKVIALSAKPVQQDLADVGEMIEVGKVKPVIGRRFEFEETAQALQYYGERHPAGKVVVNIDVS
jgi:NADPH:quinone reductase-like Zn-dependent oxidoreductase